MLQFHSNCILTWFASCNRCPLCQEAVNDTRKISKQTSLSSSRTPRPRNIPESQQRSVSEAPAGTANGPTVQNVFEGEASSLDRLNENNGQPFSRNASQLRNRPGGRPPSSLSSRALTPLPTAVPPAYLNDRQLQHRDTSQRPRSLADEQIHRDAQKKKLLVSEKEPEAGTPRRKKKSTYSYIDYDCCRFETEGTL